MVNSLSNHYNLSRDYNQFRKQIPRLNPFSPNNIIKGNKLKLPDSNKSSLHSVEPENSRLQRKNSLQQQANLQRVVIQNGNKLEVYTRRVSQTQNQAKLRSELEAHSSQLVAGQVNGNKVYLNAKKGCQPGAHGEP
ncbi:MAG TPA: hypothetical protein VHY08_12220 [Bacillota bacterium]|nr:hypothetical protein [Bacillota bacterium]